MAGVGEASAIISIVELGFSLAQALNTYVSAIAAAPDDVSSLSGEIASTSLHLKSLEGLVIKNNETKAWDDDGVELAKTSIADCEKIVRRLRGLLQKASWKQNDEQNSTFVASEIDLSKFERIMWPRLKPDLNVCKVDLQRVKLNLILAYNSYMIATVSTESEKNEYRNAIKGLKRARKWNARKIKRAKERRRSPDPILRTRRPASQRMELDSFDMEEERDLELQEEFERFLELEDEKEEEQMRILVLAEENKKRDAEEQKRKKIEQKAIEDYTAKIRKVEDETKKKKIALQKKMGERGGLTQQQIEAIIEDVYPKNANTAALVLKNTPLSYEEQANSDTVLDGEDKSDSRPSSRLSGFRNLFRTSNSNKISDPNVSIVGATKPSWSDTVSGVGVAKLESWYISVKLGGISGQCMLMPLPPPTTIKHLINAEASNKKGFKSFTPVFDVLISLSPTLVNEINYLLKQRAREKPNHECSILSIYRPEIQEKRRSTNREQFKLGPFKLKIDRPVEAEGVKDVCVILKYEESALERQKETGGTRSESPDSLESETRRRVSSSLLPEPPSIYIRAPRKSSISQRSSSFKPSPHSHMQKSRTRSQSQRVSYEDEYKQPRATRIVERDIPTPPPGRASTMEIPARSQSYESDGRWHVKPPANDSYYREDANPRGESSRSADAIQISSRYYQPRTISPRRTSDEQYYGNRMGSLGNEPVHNRAPSSYTPAQRHSSAGNELSVQEIRREYPPPGTSGYVTQRTFFRERESSPPRRQRRSSFSSDSDSDDSRERDRVPYISRPRPSSYQQPQRRSSIGTSRDRMDSRSGENQARDLRPTVVDADDEDSDMLSSDKEILVDRLVEKYSQVQPETNGNLTDETKQSEDLRHIPTELSDIVEVSESESGASSKENEDTGANRETIRRENGGN